LAALACPAFFKFITEGAYRMEGLYILGGRQKKTVLNRQDEWNLYD
jgi:hypothetical protein